MTYCYKCPRCGTKSESAIRDEPLMCGPCFLEERSVQLVRDYQAESVGIGEGVRASRDKGINEARIAHAWAEGAAG